MNELSKTLVFVAVALALCGAAFVSTRDRSVRDEAFNDQGQPFFPDFKDPLACTDLEVVDFDPSTATASRFQVKFKDGKWVIPSHYHYPADARDRLSKTAAAVMDLAKDTIRSDRAEDQEEMGVIDPLDTKTTTLKGRGKRITLRDASEKVLADFIIGNEVKGTQDAASSTCACPARSEPTGSRSRPSLRPGSPTGSRPTCSSSKPASIRKIEFDNYKVNLEQGYQRGEVLDIDRKDASAAWTMAGLSADQELDSDKLRTLTDALADLKIVGRSPQARRAHQGPEAERQGGHQADSHDRRLVAEQGILHDQGRTASFRPGRCPRLHRRGGRLHPPLRRGRSSAPAMS